MTIGGALSELNNLLKADDIPIYYKPSIKAVIDTITLEQEPYICDTCKHKDAEWDTEPCDGCCGNHSGYEPQEGSEE